MSLPGDVALFAQLDRAVIELAEARAEAHELARENVDYQVALTEARAEARKLREILLRVNNENAEKETRLAAVAALCDYAEDQRRDRITAGMVTIAAVRAALRGAE